MRVDLLTPCFWPEVRRGTERFVRELADGLIANGDEPRLVTSHRGRPSRAVEDGLPIVRVPRPPDGRLERRRYEHHLTHVPFSYAVLRAGDAQLAHAFAPPEAAMAARWSARSGRPSVFSFMGVPDHTGLVERRKRVDLVVSALHGCDATVALSEHAAEAFRYWLGHEPRVIAPGVDLDRFAIGAERTPEPTVVCSAAAHEPRKRVDLLVAAWPAVRREHPGARLLLDRRRAARFEDPAGGIELVDMDDTRTLAALNGAAWAAALPSVGEAFGLVLVEALATGTPVVGSAGGAFEEIVDRPQIGRLFDGGAPELAQALLETFELASDPATRTACRARAEDFPAARTAELYAELYREIRDARG